MNYAEYVQTQVSEEDWGVLQGRGISFADEILVDFWPEFVNNEKRWEKEVPFLLQCTGRGSSVFDASLGAGVTSIGLKRAGLENIISNDIDFKFIAKAQEEARKYGVDLTVTSYDWRELPDKFAGRFSAVTCLGNAFSELFKREDQLLSLRNFRRVLQHQGVLIIDERNYEEILQGRYHYSGEVVYCGKEAVEAQPVLVSPTVVAFEYRQRSTGNASNLIMHPFRRGELFELLEEACFRDIKVFGDYERNFKWEEPEFLTYVCRA